MTEEIISAMKNGAEEDPDAELAESSSRIPRQFIWPHSTRSCTNVRPNVLQAPVIDLADFITAGELVKPACKDHGFFQVINHGVDSSLLRAAMNCIADFFRLPLSEKLKARGNLHCRNWGYAGAGAHSDRFATKLPWKETLSFGSDTTSDSMVADYFVSTFGDGFKEMGAVYQKYCEAMMKLALIIMELLGLSLGVDRAHFREYFGDGNSIMRCNYYPPCQEPELTFGTGPHCDPTSITILLQQDGVDGLEVFSQGEWRVVSPVRGALIVNIGDTFMALSNGMYKSCLHRAVVNKVKERRSLAFFLCPRINRIVRPPECLVNEENPRKYPDFTWAELFDFTQKHYRADMETLPTFTDWLLSSSRSYSRPSPHNSLE